MHTFCGAALAAALVVAGASAVRADDWTAVELRGQVLQMLDGQWQPLARGAVVPDSRFIRTMATGHVVLTRGQETLDLGPNTQVQIYDRGTAALPDTTVKEQFGTLSVEAQIENVQHFAVQTTYLAAVVKGTKFTVTSNKTGASVSVQRGHVEVDDHHDKSHTLISVGQSATVDAIKTNDEIAVSGSGTLPPVLAANGKVLTEDVSTKSSGKSGNDSSGKDKSGDEESANTNDDSNSDNGNGNSGTGNGKGNSGNGNGNGGSNGKNGKGKS